MLAVPNFATGDPATARRLQDAMAACGLRILDIHHDADHWRTVISAEGGPDSIVAAALASNRVASDAIDMQRYSGAHPAIGAVDVYPVVYPDPGQREEAIATARDVARALGDAGVPVFLYGGLATSAERRERAYFRRGGTSGLAARADIGETPPDHGPARIDPRRGATLVTARPPLLAFNVIVEGMDAETAAAIAAEIREREDGGLPGVRALAIPLAAPDTSMDDPTATRRQISTNIHDPLTIRPARVVEAVRARAEAAGGRVVAAEIVGLVPRQALADFPSDVPIEGFDPSTQTLG